jgi:hypothetical protein
VDADTGKAISIERIEMKGEDSEQAYDADDRPPKNNAGGEH